MSTCTDYGRTVEVDFVRRFKATQRELGVGFDQESWFVYDRDMSELHPTWHKHCGPYSDRSRAEWWINRIQETTPPSGAER